MYLLLADVSAEGESFATAVGDYEKALQLLTDPLPEVRINCKRSRKDLDVYIQRSLLPSARCACSLVRLPRVATQLPALLGLLYHCSKQAGMPVLAPAHWCQSCSLPIDA